MSRRAATRRPARPAVLPALLGGRRGKVVRPRIVVARGRGAGGDAELGGIEEEVADAADARGEHEALEQRVVVFERGVHGGGKQTVDLGVPASERDGRQFALAERQLHAAKRAVRGEGPRMLAKAPAESLDVAEHAAPGAGACRRSRPRGPGCRRPESSAPRRCHRRSRQSRTGRLWRRGRGRRRFLASSCRCSTGRARRGSDRSTRAGHARTAGVYEQDVAAAAQRREGRLVDGGCSRGVPRATRVGDDRAERRPARVCVRQKDLGDGDRRPGRRYSLRGRRAGACTSPPMPWRRRA
jgi:hypothetical protein